MTDMRELPPGRSSLRLGDTVDCHKMWVELIALDTRHKEHCLITTAGGPPPHIGQTDRIRMQSREEPFMYGQQAISWLAIISWLIFRVTLADINTVTRTVTCSTVQLLSSYLRSQQIFSD